MTTPWTLPELGENISKATVLQVLVQPGAVVTATTPLLEVETDKVNVEVPAGRAGAIATVQVAAGDIVKPGAALFQFEGETTTAGTGDGVQSAGKQGAGYGVQGADVQSPTPGTRLPAPNATSLPAPRPPYPVPNFSAGPLARKLARELGLELDAIPASGPDGLLLQSDVTEYARGLIEQVRGAAPTAKATALPDFQKFGTITREPMSNIRAVTAERMTTAWTTIPHVTQFDHADTSAIETLRQKFSSAVEKQGGKLTMTVLLMRAVTHALQQHRQFNASIDLARHDIIFKQFYHVGIAVDTPQGLVVPVVRDVDKKSLTELARELPQLAAKARERKLTLDDVQGGTFTISNLGGIGGTNFTPIINPPEVAILAVSRSEWVQIKVGTKWKPALRLPLGLSYDHRLIDGADAARFLRLVATRLESPDWVTQELGSGTKKKIAATPRKKSKGRT